MLLGSHWLSLFTQNLLAYVKWISHIQGIRFTTGWLCQICTHLLKLGIIHVLNYSVICLWFHKWTSQTLFMPTITSVKNTSFSTLQVYFSLVSSLFQKRKVESHPSLGRTAKLGKLQKAREIMYWICCETWKTSSGRKNAVCLIWWSTYRSIEKNMKNLAFYNYWARCQKMMLCKLRCYIFNFHLLLVNKPQSSRNCSV